MRRKARAVCLHCIYICMYIADSDGSGRHVFFVLNTQKKQKKYIFFCVHNTKKDCIFFNDFVLNTQKKECFLCKKHKVKED